MLIRLNKYKCG